MVRVFNNHRFRLLAFTVCILLFSSFIHHPLPMQLVSFFCIVILSYIFATESPFIPVFTGEGKRRSIIAAWTVIAVAASFITAMVSRKQASLTMIPASLGIFTIVAMMIGSMEEFIFRGWMFSQFRRGWRWQAVLISALAHAAYKALLFTSGYLPYEVNKWELFQVTFEAGIFLGLTRLFSRSVWPALIAHAIFDLLIYGDQSVPWWIF
jgi:membrane protease YdiL (CAAX protease family)